MSDLEAAFFEAIFSGEGVSELAWERATRCDCYKTDTQQPSWGCPDCGGSGVKWSAPQTVKALFRSQSRYLSFRREGELAHGDAELTTPLDVKPSYTDRRVRDRFKVLQAAGDSEEGRVFYPAAQATPFLVNNIQRAWRVTLQAADQTDRLVPQ